jgi:hypothetical protein
MVVAEWQQEVVDIEEYVMTTISIVCDNKKISKTFMEWMMSRGEKDFGDWCDSQGVLCQPPTYNYPCSIIGIAETENRVVDVNNLKIIDESC